MKARSSVAPLLAAGQWANMGTARQLVTDRGTEKCSPVPARLIVDSDSVDYAFKIFSAL